ncbi:MAG TPA: UDP-N-acetylglucosamine 1-carboxyvinyltransferase, partial [Thermoanaerobaculia bacterium]|nr:UDP-N-acetylglucosamine 1-carboxyvinyltransferase [Thermoanaerobaculia bacterium]
RHTIPPDRIEVGTYLLAAAITAGDVTVTNAAPDDLSPLLERLEEIGCRVDTDLGSIRVRAAAELKARDIVTAPHPGFPTDLQAQYMAVMTQAQGKATICETVFENRFQHVAELNRLGAEIAIDGAYARVQGPTELSGTRVMATDLRASAGLVLAAMAARGETVIERIYHLDRGYDAMEVKLRALGAEVTRTSETAGAAESDLSTATKESAR